MYFTFFTPYLQLFSNKGLKHNFFKLNKIKRKSWKKGKFEEKYKICLNLIN